MRIFHITIWDILLLIILISCVEEIKILSSNELEVRRNKAYIIKSNIPFNGMLIDYYDSGQKQTEITYKNGLKNGVETSWYKNGRKISTVEYQNGLKERDMTYYDIDGSVIGQYSYKNDKLIYLTLDGKTVEYFINAPSLVDSSVRSNIISLNEKSYKVLDDDVLKFVDMKNFLTKRKENVLNEIFAVENKLKSFLKENKNPELSDNIISLVQLCALFEAERNKVQIESEILGENIKQFKDFLRDKNDPRFAPHKNQVSSISDDKMEEAESSPIINGQLLFELHIMEEIYKAHLDKLMDIVSSYINRFNDLPAKKLEFVSLQFKKQSLEKFYIELEDKYDDIL